MRATNPLQQKNWLLYNHKSCIITPGSGKGFFSYLLLSPWELQACVFSGSQSWNTLLC